MYLELENKLNDQCMYVQSRHFLVWELDPVIAGPHLSRVVKEHGTRLILPVILSRSRPSSHVLISQKRRVHLTPEQTSDFYAEHYGKMFFPSLVAYMSSGPIIAMVLARESAIACWRELCGPTNTNKARETHPDR